MTSNKTDNSAEVVQLKSVRQNRILLKTSDVQMAWLGAILFFIPIRIFFANSFPEEPVPPHLHSCRFESYLESLEKYFILPKNDRGNKLVYDIDSF